MYVPWAMHNVLMMVYFWEWFVVELVCVLLVQ